MLTRKQIIILTIVVLMLLIGTGYFLSRPGEGIIYMENAAGKQGGRRVTPHPRVTIPSASKRMGPKYKNIFEMAKQEKFDRIFQARQDVSTVILPKTMDWKGLFGNRFPQSLVEHQITAEVYNEYTFEDGLYGTLRMKDYKIEKTPEAIKAGLDNIVKRGKPQESHCPFCHSKTETAHEQWGRIESTYSISSTNIKKYTKHHGLVLMKNHHPLRWTHAIWIDTWQSIEKWIEKLNVPGGRGQVCWDATPAASASQIHPHFQVAISENRYFGHFEFIKMAAQQYKMEQGRDFFTDMIEMHDQVGLAAFYKGAAILANMAPKNDQEVIVVANSKQSLYEGLFVAARGLIDKAGAQSLSLSVSFGPQSNSMHYGRMMTRGAPFAEGSDFGAAEMYTGALISYDPYVVIAAIQKLISEQQ